MAGAGGRFLREQFARLRGDRLAQALGVVLAALLLSSPASLPRLPFLVDWPTVAAMGGLLLVIKGIELSGALQRLARRLAARMPTERRLALFLAGLTAGLSAVVTNDVALFVMVPLTLAFRRFARLPVGRLVIFEALAANAGSMLTPVGNPQNLFIWHQSGLGFAAFVAMMLPLTAATLAALGLLTAVSFRRRPIHLETGAESPVRYALFCPSLVLFALYLALINTGHAVAGAAALLLLYLVFRPAVAGAIDWTLLLVFALMFADLRLVGELPLVRQAVHALHPEAPLHLYLSGILLSQVISNVPSAILLAGFSRNWPVLAQAVSAGGFGLAVGSLANLIALRLGAEKGLALKFHAYSIPFLAVTGLVGSLLMR